MNLDSVSNASALAFTFTESPVFIRPYESDDSSYPSANTTYDGALQLPSPLPKGHWTQPSGALRGGFRYLTITSTSTGSVTISNVTCDISFMPHVENMRDYSGYFRALDPVFHDENFLTKVSIPVEPLYKSILTRLYWIDLVCRRVHCPNQHCTAEHRQTSSLR